MLKYPITRHEFRGLLPGTFNQSKKVAVAVSGGVDSLALALLINEETKSTSVDLHSFTIDHGLRKGSASEAQAVHSLLSSLNVQNEVLSIPKLIPGAGLEESARHARYHALTRACLHHDIRNLYVAHHADDQVETIFLRLINGSRWRGLQGMLPLSHNPVTSSCLGAHSIYLHRPLLEVSKCRLVDTCHQFGVSWFEDETNADTTLATRNALRSVYQQPATLPRALQKPSLLALSKDMRARLQKAEDLEAALTKACRIRLCSETATLSFDVAPVTESPLTKDSILSFLERIASIITPVESIRTVRMRVVVEALLKHGQDTDEYNSTAAGLLWKFQNGRAVVSRQPLMRAEDVSVLLDAKAVDDTETARLDRRYFIQVLGFIGQVKLRMLCEADMARVRKLAEAHGKAKALADLLQKAPGHIRYTLPVAVERTTDKILGLPSGNITFHPTVQFKCDLVGQPFLKRLIRGSVNACYEEDMRLLQCSD